MEVRPPWPSSAPRIRRPVVASVSKRRPRHGTQAPANRLRFRGRCRADRSARGGGLMKRLAIWAFYGVGALAIAYLALYAYAMLTGRVLQLQPGDPIHIFRKPDAPSYS